MKAKNFLFTAVLTFGAILFATNVSAQEEVKRAIGAASAEVVGTSPEAKVELVLKLKDFQELTVNPSIAKVEYTFDTRAAYKQAGSSDINVENQLTAFSTKQFDIKVEATNFTTGIDGETLPDVLSLFTVQATNNTSEGDKTGEELILKTDEQTLLKAQKKTKNSAGNTIDIKYSLKNPDKLLDKMGEIDVKNAEDSYTSIVTYTITAR